MALQLPIYEQVELKPTWQTVQLVKLFLSRLLTARKLNVSFKETVNFLAVNKRLKKQLNQLHCLPGWF